MPEAVTERIKMLYRERTGHKAKGASCGGRKRMRVKVKGGCCLLLRHLECP